jgi:5-hydroxyisourate hydrolase
MISVSTHVLDTAGGGARPGVAVTLLDTEGTELGAGVTDADGRIASLASGLATGTYTLTFNLEGPFLTAIAVAVRLGEDRHYHVPVLASGWSAVTYLGT